MCCEADWKREVVQDYKWEYVDVRDFHDTSIMTRVKYGFVYVFILRNLVIYGLDIFTAVTMLATDNWTNNLYTKCKNEGENRCLIDVQFKIAKWVFIGCIIFSFLLLGYEWYKARMVIKSRDISYAFTNVMANDYFSIKKYDNFCLFCRISSSTKSQDKIAFFVFFTFKTWKRTILADGPRQSINAIILFMIAKAYNFSTDDIPKYWDNSPWTALLLFAMITTVLLFIISLVLLIVAAVLYLPLLCYIQGNMKEYVCHKVDKRIGEIIRKQQKKRIARNAALETKLMAGGQVVNSRGEVVDANLLKPTLPNISLDDIDDTKGGRASPALGRAVTPSYSRSASPAFSAKPYAAAPDYPDSKAVYEDIYDSYSDTASAYAYPPPRGSNGTAYDEEYMTSTSSLVAHAAPPARQFSRPPPRPSTPLLEGAPDFPPGAAPDYPPSTSPSYPPQVVRAQHPPGVTHPRAHNAQNYGYAPEPYWR